MFPTTPVYTDMVLNGRKKFSKLPEFVKEEVKSKLLAMGREDLIDEKVDKTE